MSTKRQKRKTKQMRIETTWHMRLRMLAFEKGTTASRLSDEVFEHYFKCKSKEVAKFLKNIEM